MKKRILTPALSLFLTAALALPAFALEYTVEGMESLAGSSPAVRQVDYAVAAMPDADDYGLQLTKLGENLSALQAQKNFAKGLAEDSSIDPNVKALASGVYNVLESSEVSIRGSAGGIAAQMTTAKVQILSAKAQQAGVKETVAYSAESLLLSYYDLQNRETELKINLRKLERSLSQMNKMQELGMISALDREKFASSLEELRNTLSTLADTKTALVGNLNVLLGKNFSEANTVGALKNVTLDDLKTVKPYKDGLDTALKNNKRLEYLNEKVSELGRLYDSDIPTNYSKAGAETEALDYRRQAEAAFYSVHSDLEAKKKSQASAERTLALAQKDLELAQKKYELGMLSKNDFENAKDDYEIARLAAGAFEISLKKSYRAYAYALKGIVIKSA